MTKVELLMLLKDFTKNATTDIVLPVRRQESDLEQPDPRPADVYCMRLIKGGDAKKAAPYIIHQVITGKDAQSRGARISGNAVVRSIFCVYNEDEQEGSLSLLGLMERMRIAFLEKVVIGNRYQLDLEAGLEMLIYPDDTAPYYIGEFVTTWTVPGVEREVVFFGEQK